MMPGGHLATAAALGAAGYALTGSAELAAGCFAGGFLIDVDHYLDYLVFEGQWRRPGPADFLRYYFTNQPRRIVLPLAMPGIQAGCILVFVLSLSAYVTPALIGGLRVKTMAVSVVDALIDTFQWPFGSAMALLLSLTGGLVVAVFARMTRMKWKVDR